MNYSVELPEEIVTEILLKLPVKSILKFKTVCQFWYSIVNDTHFTKRHLKLALSAPESHHRTFPSLCFYGGNRLNPQLLHNQDDGIVHAKALEIPPQYGFYTVFNSCDGLLCFSDRDRKQIFIWNPCLPTEVKIIPSQPFIQDYIAMVYDPNSDDYKILKLPLSSSVEDKHFRVEIFSFKSNIWKPIWLPLSNISFDYFITESLVYANNRVHWLAAGSYEGDNTGFCIVYFDLVEGSLKQMNLPPRRLYFLRLMNYKDSIAIAGDDNYLGPGLEYWVLKDYCGMKSSWNKAFSLKFIDNSNYGFCVIITWNGEICVRAREGGFRIYDPEDDDIKGNKVTLFNHSGWSFLPFPYFQSLLSPTRLH